MVPKRVKSAKPVAATKRTKATIYRDSDSESEVEARSQKLKKGRVTIQLPSDENNQDQDDDDDDDDDDEPLTRTHKPKQPKPRKKMSNSTTQPKPTEASSSTKQKSTLADIANTLHNNNTSNSTNSNKQVSISKSKKEFPSENQENIDARQSKDGGGKVVKKPMQKSSSVLTYDQLTAALDDQKEKHRRLRQLRETDAERNLAECRAQLDETIRSAENYRKSIEPQLESTIRLNEKLRETNEITNAKARTLQRQVRDLEEKLKQRDQEDRIKAKTASMESVLASPDVTPNTAWAISTIKMYENLSGFKLVPRDTFPRSNKEKVPAIWDCEHSGPRGTLQFTLTYNYSINTVSYTPNIDKKRDEKLLKSLPDYLTVEIEFDREFESKFFWRILNFNNDDNK
ncbi:hypothetical protein BGX23_005162 [Mortierella sp. AD031]|nr:hypothetical protein BGX23_005162 [Mortierella sp. AD031]